MSKDLLPGSGFEIKEGQVIPNVMPLGPRFYSFVALLSTPDFIPNLEDEKLKAVEIYADEDNDAPIFVTDESSPAQMPAVHLKKGRRIEPGRSVSYPLRGRGPSSSDPMDRPKIYGHGAIRNYTITLGR